MEKILLTKIIFSFRVIQELPEVKILWSGASPFKEK